YHYTLRLLGHSSGRDAASFDSWTFFIFAAHSQCLCDIIKKLINPGRLGSGPNVVPVIARRTYAATNVVISFGIRAGNPRDRSRSVGQQPAGIRSPDQSTTLTLTLILTLSTPCGRPTRAPSRCPVRPVQQHGRKIGRAHV